MKNLINSSYCQSSNAKVRKPQQGGGAKMAEWKTVEPGTWKPAKEGDSVEGVLMNKQPKEGQLSARYLVETNKDGKTEVVLVWGSTVLDDRLSVVPVGSLVRITFKGKQKNKRGQDLNIYKVEVAQK